MAIEVTDGLNIIAAIICEDVRPETGNKWSLLGVFAGNIIVPTIPANVRLGIYIEANATKPYCGSVHMRTRLNDKTVMEILGELDAGIGTLTLPVPAQLVPLPTAGMIHFEASTDKVHWVEFASKELILGSMKDGIVIPPNAS